MLGASVVIVPPGQSGPYPSDYWQKLRGLLPDQTYLCDETNQDALIRQAFAHVGTGKVYIAPGTLRPNLTNGPVSIPSNVTVEVSAGATIFPTGTVGTNGSPVYVFKVDGTTTARENVWITGAGQFYATGTDQALLYVEGDVRNVRWDVSLSKHGDSAISRETPVYLRGNKGQGVRDVRVEGMFQNWGYASGEERVGAVVMDGDVKRVKVDITSDRTAYGVTAWFRDVSPVAVLNWDDSAATYVAISNVSRLYDGSTASAAGTDGTIALDANDWLDICFAQRTQVLRWFINATQNVNSPTYLEASVLSGTTWTRQSAIWDETGTTGGGGNQSAVFERTGNYYWGEPNELEWTESTLQGTSGFWLRIRPVIGTSVGTTAWYGGTGTGSGGSLRGVGFTEILGFTVPRQIKTEGFVFDSKYAGVQARGALGVKNDMMAQRVRTHAANYNSHETELLGAQDERYMPTMFFHDTGLYIETQDAMVTQRASAFGKMSGVYIGAEPAVVYEQVDPGDVVDEDSNLVRFTHFDGLVALAGRAGLRIQGFDNLIGGMVVANGRYRELTQNSEDKTGISIEHQNMSAPVRNIIDSVIIDTPNNARQRSAVATESDATGTNWFGPNAVLINGFTSAVRDLGTSMRYGGSLGSGGMLRQYGTFTLPVSASSTGTIAHLLSSAPSWAHIQVVGDTTLSVRVLSVNASTILARVESVAGTGAGSGTYTVMGRWEV